MLIKTLVTHGLSGWMANLHLMIIGTVFIARRGGADSDGAKALGSLWESDVKTGGVSKEASLALAACLFTTPAVTVRRPLTPPVRMSSPRWLCPHSSLLSIADNGCVV